MSRSRELQAASRRIRIVGKKSSPDRLRALLTQFVQMPVLTAACRVVGCHPSSVKYWLALSMDGKPGFQDLLWNGVVQPFHEHWKEATQSGLDLVEEAGFKRAIGYQEVGEYQGRVVYQQDPEMIALGFEGPQAYLKDEHGKPIPEMFTRQDPDLIQFILKNRRSEVYGNKATVDHNVRGGVLVIGVTPKTSAEFEKTHANKREEIQDVEFEEVPPDDTDAQ